MSWRKSYCEKLPFKKLERVSIVGINPIDADKTMSNEFPGCVQKDAADREGNLSVSYKLLWFKSKLNGQSFDFLLDCGASICCIAKRCVTSNHVLRNLPTQPYRGIGLVGANGKSLVVENVICLKVEVGSPTLTVEVDFVICNKCRFKKPLSSKGSVVTYFNT